MSKFEELDKRKTSEVESEISLLWDSIDILNKSINNRKESFVFYDGPATANGMPGLHHMMAKFLKDTFCKYKTMKGYKVIRKVGWDTHGLPVELEVEKELGFTSKLDIEKYGIEKFNQKCRESVWKNEKAFRDFTVKMGQFIDLEHPYITYENNYIETEWHILKKFFDEGLIYEGHKILPYCPRCGTGLASHEVAQGYKDVSVETVTVPMKIVGEDDTYFLVWTTTPWTLLSNVAICVNPNEEYVKCESRGHRFILASSLVNKILGEEYTILNTYKGSELEYMEYEQLLPFLNVNKKAFYVTCDNYVTMEDGTGIVHIAPAFGADDYEVSKKYDLPILNPVGEDGKYTDGPWKGTFVIDADIEIIKYLKENDKLFKKEKIVHNYPHCWRCDTPLLYYSKPSWYIEVTKFKDKIIECNNTVNWYPDYIGEKRFSNWLENLNDWAISRNRYWGTPLPLWVCDCGHKIMVGSIDELVNLSIENIDHSIELHRPYVDDVHIKCPKCNNTMNRVKDVIDCWFDSGSMPFAQYHYPFETEMFNNQFPADFISEGVDQTRGWFYTLLIISTFMTGKAPYKNVLVNDLLLDKYGKKMSKSKGNSLNPFELIDEYGADTIRWYLPYVSPVWTPLKFDIEGLKEVYSKFFNPLKNTYNFFVLYANTDNVDPRVYEVDKKDLEEIDLWLLSKYNKLIYDVTLAYEEFDLNKVVKKITEFVSEDLSNWYIRRNRKRFWGSELDNSKKAVYKVTYDVLVGLSKLIAPITPFIAEEMYRKLTCNESVHLADFPIYDESLINVIIEEKMDLVRNLISIGRYVREEAKIKVRQPLSEALIDGKNKELIGDLTSLIIEELNVKEVNYIDDLSIYMDFMVKPNFKVAGPIFGPDIKYFTESISKLKIEEINALNNGETIDILVNNSNYTIVLDMVDIRMTAKIGYNQGMENNNFIILNTELTDDLISEGIAREIVSKVQQIRKNEDLNIVDRITIFCECDDEVKNAIDKHLDYIKNETLAVNIEFNCNSEEVYDINNHSVKLDIEKM